MFPFDESNQWMAQISSCNPSSDFNSQLPDLFAGKVSPTEGTDNADAMKMEDTHQKIVSNYGENVETEERKIMRRDLERERRKQMASLLTDLRSFLPLELIKGKRLKADLLNEAANYIEYLRGKISELHIRRDALKSSSSMSKSSDLCSSDFIVMNPFSGGLEIVISSCRDPSLQLSRVMKVLLEESIDVDHCSSANVNEKMFHTIYSKVVDSTRINVPELQHKLYQVCNFRAYGG